MLSRTLHRFSKRTFSSFGGVCLPLVKNEPPLHYAPNSPERNEIIKSLKKLRNECPDIPCIVNGEEIRTNDIGKQVICSDHQQTLCTYHKANKDVIKDAIDSSMNAKKKWEQLPVEDRLAIFTKASYLLSKVNRFEVNAATMLGQGKTLWQAEIDSAMELIDFWRFGSKFVSEMYNNQSLENDAGVWNRLEYRPLEGFVLAISPFNFTAIGGNLPGTPAMVGNTVIWKPSSTSILSNYLIYKILIEAGLPPGVINFIPCQGSTISEIAIKNENLGAINFTGSTEVFRNIWNVIGSNIHSYKSYPRIVGETGGKNFHFLHNSCDIESVVNGTIRGSFEYQGQKCSATSRLYCPKSIWDKLKQRLLEETKKIKMGQPEEFECLMSAVIDQNSFNNIKNYINQAKNDKNSEILIGGQCDDSKGYFVQPTIIQTSNPKFTTMCNEIFGPVLTCYVYDDNKLEETLAICDETSDYALTGAIFGRDRDILSMMSNRLRHSAGNFYINDKCTGSIVGQQPFGGARASGTNDKAGYQSIFYRFVSIRSIKETFLPQTTWRYPSMD